eukprot:4172097-Prymnesium_polylepis.1
MERVYPNVTGSHRVPSYGIESTLIWSVSTLIWQARAGREAEKRAKEAELLQKVCRRAPRSSRAYRRISDPPAPGAASRPARPPPRLDPSPPTVT